MGNELLCRFGPRYSFLTFSLYCLCAHLKFYHSQKDKGSHEASVDAVHHAFLEKMGTKYSLKDGTSKALRVIVEFAMTDGDVADIYTKARCDKWGAGTSS